MIDREVLAHLSTLFVDIEGLVASLSASQADQSSGLQAERDAAAERLADLQLRDGKLRERLAVVIGEDRDPRAIEETLAQQRPEHDAAAQRLADLDQRLSSIENADPADTALDFWSQLRDEVAGALKGSTVREVREALAVRFEAFVLNSRDGAVTVLPLLRVESAASAAIDFLAGRETPSGVPLTVQTSPRAKERDSQR